MDAALDALAANLQHLQSAARQPGDFRHHDHEEHNALSAAFITAWNPSGQQLSSKQNDERQQALKDELKRRGLKFIKGTGQHPSNNWPGDASVLVLDLKKESAKSLAGHHEQHAFVWAASDAMPELVLP